MSASHDSSAQPVANSIASDGNINNSFMQTPVSAAGTTVFLRKEGSTTFMPVYHQSSVTLRDLAEEFNVSSVLECDAQGNVQPRAVAFDSPSDILHSGRHYIARRDAKAETGSSYVTFKGKICVKEYELEHPTPPSTCQGKSVATIGVDGNEGVLAETSCRKPVATPFTDKSRQQAALISNEEYLVVSTAEDGTPKPRQMVDEEAVISRTLALSSERKRPRDESASVTRENPTASQRTDDDCENVAPGNQDSERSEGMQSIQSPTPRNGGVFVDRTNYSSLKTQVIPLASEFHTDETTTLQSSKLPAPLATATAAPQPQKQTLRFIPFTETAADGTETYVTLESLHQLCSNLSTQEAEFQKKHRTATDILECARRVLFLNDGND